MNMTPENVSPVELAATPEDEAEETPDPHSTLQQLTDEFTGKLLAAGLFEYFEVDIEKWMCSLDRFVVNKFM